MDGWSSEYEFGIAEMDEHHRGMVDMVDSLWQALVRNAGSRELGELLVELERVTVEHFAAEEQLMSSDRYPGLVDHCANHRAFAQRISHARERHQHGETVDLATVGLLRSWLFEHLARADREFAEFSLGRRSRRSPLRRFFRRFAV